MSTEAERRLAMEQALANSRIEGHRPTPEHLADMEAWVKGTMSVEEGIAAALTRAKAADAAALQGTTDAHAA